MGCNMNAESVGQCLAELGCCPEKAGQIVDLLEAAQLSEAQRKLRCLRCELMEELHGCQRRVDRLDWLIRETEKNTTK